MSKTISTNRFKTYWTQTTHGHCLRWHDLLMYISFLNGRDKELYKVVVNQFLLCTPCHWCGVSHPPIFISIHKHIKPCQRITISKPFHGTFNYKECYLHGNPCSSKQCMAGLCTCENVLLSWCRSFFFPTCAHLLFWAHAVNLIACRVAVQEEVCLQRSSSEVQLCKRLIPAATTPTDYIFPL